jgi:hypothetical protein
LADCQWARHQALHLAVDFHQSVAQLSRHTLKSMKQAPERRSRRLRAAACIDLACFSRILCALFTVGRRVTLDFVTKNSCGFKGLMVTFCGGSKFREISLGASLFAPVRNLGTARLSADCESLH